MMSDFNRQETVIFRVGVGLAALLLLPIGYLYGVTAAVLTALIVVPLVVAGLSSFAGLILTASSGPKVFARGVVRRRRPSRRRVA